MSQSIAETILEGSKALRLAEISEPRREAASLLAYSLDKDQTYLLTHADALLTEAELVKFRQNLGRRSGGEPMQYISGVREFFGLDFEVNPDVLIPRPETELLVETALALIGNRKAPILICDIGAGTGCISIALVSKVPNARAIAVDISSAAVTVAARNASRHHLTDRLTLVVADGFSALQARPIFDLIVSNPPYIADGEWEGLQREVRDHEPRLALTSGSDGFKMVRRLIKEAPALLRAGGSLLIEIGYNQSVAIEKLVDPQVWEFVGIHKDLQGIPRTVELRKTQSGISEDLP